MKITQFTDFSFRLLMYLAANRGRVVTVREVADHYDISVEHLKKVVRGLVELGHVATVRGKLGGLKLARPPEDIPLARLIRHQESFDLLPCYENGHGCVLPECRLRGLMDQALGNFLATFDGKTLADIL